MSSKQTSLADIRLLAIDIDGTLTDGLLAWGGEAIGWTQSYAVRDGEAIVRLVASGVPVVPISRNKTLCARVRMQHLRLPLHWVGVSDKMAAFREVQDRYQLPADAIAYVGVGAEDVPLLQAVGIGWVPNDGHPAAQRVAHVVTAAKGGRGAVEEAIEALLAAHAAAPLP